MDHAPFSYPTGQSATVTVRPDLEFLRYRGLDWSSAGTGRNLEVRMTLVFDESAAQYVVDGLTVHRRTPEISVDGVTLRSLAVQEMIGEMNMAVPIVGAGEEMPEVLPDDLVASIKKAGPSDIESLRWLARVYVRAYAFRRPPAKAVQEQLKMPAPTASVWIRRARDRGLFPDALGSGRHMSTEEFLIAKRNLRGFTGGRVTEWDPVSDG